MGILNIPENGERSNLFTILYYFTVYKQLTQFICKLFVKQFFLKNLYF